MPTYANRQLQIATRGPSPQSRRSLGEPSIQCFRSAEEAWLWTMAALVARREGARYTANQGKVARPCEPDDVVRSLDRLYRQRRIDLMHARVLRLWGERGCAPDPRHPTEHFDWTVWKEAMDRLEWPLRIKGIVGG